MPHQPLSGDGNFYLHLHDANLAQRLSAEELHHYKSLSVDAQIVVAHRLYIGDSFEVAKRQLFILADESKLYQAIEPTY